MLNLRKRIKNLQESTSSLEAKAVCNEILENFINLPDTQISVALVEKLKSVGDADKHVNKFIQVAEKIDAINNLGVASAIAQIKEMQIYSYPGLRYTLEKIENTLSHKQVSVVENDNVTNEENTPGRTWSGLNMGKTTSFRLQENRMGGKPEYMLIDSLLESLKNFIWDQNIEVIYTELKNKRIDLTESIDIAASIYNIKNGKGSFFYDSILPKLEEHFVNPTESSRSSVLEMISKFNFSPEIKALSESLTRIQKQAKGGIQMVAENSKCTVSSIYSPVLLENASEFFFAKGNFFSKADGKIAKLEENKLAELPSKFKDICRILTSPNVFIKEGKISFYLKRNKVEILENENKVDVMFNGSKVSSSELAKNMVNAGLFRLEESQIAYDVQVMAESFSNIYDLDFAKLIESNVHSGSYVIVMKDGENIYVNKVNESNRTNEFFSGLNATQARNLILEFIGFDIKESMAEYLEQDEVRLNQLRESQVEIIKNIAIIEANLLKVNDTLQDSFMKNNPEILNLKSVLEEEVSKLRASHRLLATQIRTFESKASSDAGFDVGDQVRINETGDSATVTAINSSRGTATVVTESGQSIEIPLTKVSSTEADSAKANAKNAEDDEEAVKAVSEATANLPSPKKDDEEEEEEDDEDVEGESKDKKSDDEESEESEEESEDDEDGKKKA
jgi:hypothetical protein